MTAYFALAGLIVSESFMTWQVYRLGFARGELAGMKRANEIWTKGLK